MPTLTVRLYAECAHPVQTQDLSVISAAEAREWANGKLRNNPGFTRAQIYAGETLLSEVGYRINRPDRSGP